MSEIYTCNRCGYVFTEPGSQRAMQLEHFGGWYWTWESCCPRCGYDDFTSSDESDEEDMEEEDMEEEDDESCVARRAD